jgi:hypothetical protein
MSTEFVVFIIIALIAVVVLYYLIRRSNRKSAIEFPEIDIDLEIPETRRYTTPLAPEYPSANNRTLADFGVSPPKLSSYAAIDLSYSSNDSCSSSSDSGSSSCSSGGGD